MNDMVVTFGLDEQGVDALLKACEPGQPAQFTLRDPAVEAEISGTNIPLGPAELRITASLDSTMEELRRRVAALAPGETLKVRLVNARGTCGVRGLAA